MTKKHWRTETSKSNNVHKANVKKNLIAISDFSKQWLQQLTAYSVPVSPNPNSVHNKLFLQLWSEGRNVPHANRFPVSAMNSQLHYTNEKI